MNEDDLPHPSAVQEIAALVSGSGDWRMVAATKQISYRAPIHLLAKVDALAAQAGKTRAAMLTLLLGAGVQEVMKALPSKVFEAVQVQEAQALGELANGDGSGEIA